MQHEDFTSQYNEILYKERDVIRNFLNETADIRYGNQMYEYSLDKIKVLAKNGAEYSCYGIVADKEDFVKFIVKSNDSHYETWTANDFAYGELSKIINALPEPSEFVMEDIDKDMRRWTEKYSISLEGNVFEWRDGDSVYEVHNIVHNSGDDKVKYYVKEISNSNGRVSTSFELRGKIPVKIAKKLQAHVNAVNLRKDTRYTDLVNLLFLDEGRHYNFAENGEVGSAYITLGNLSLSVLDVSNENYKLEILVSTKYTNIEDETGMETYLLTEDNIRPEYLDAIIEHLTISDVMNTYNGHNKELVEKINKAFRQPSLKSGFQTILFAIVTRDYEECEENFCVSTPESATAIGFEEAHKILEDICDDTDLETIIKFLRIE